MYENHISVARAQFEVHGWSDDGQLSALPADFSLQLNDVFVALLCSSLLCMLTFLTSFDGLVFIHLFVIFVAYSIIHIVLEYFLLLQKIFLPGCQFLNDARIRIFSLSPKRNLILSSDSAEFSLDALNAGIVLAKHN